MGYVMKFNEEKTIHGIPIRARTIIKPKFNVTVKTEQDKEQVINTARRVIARHHKVLKALKDR